MAVVFQFQPVEEIWMLFSKTWVYVSGKVLRGVFIKDFHATDNYDFG